MAPLPQASLGIFENAHPDFRTMAWPDREYVLGTHRARAGVRANLPTGKWRITRHDVIAKDSRTLSTETSGTFTFDTPKSRAVLFHFKRIDTP